MESALLAVGKGITDLGGQDPRKISPESDINHPLLSNFLQKLRDGDDPQQRAHPVMLDMLRALPVALVLDHETNGNLNKHVVQLCIVAFFWLMRPAEEYLGRSTRDDDQGRSARSQSFRLCDIAFLINGKHVHATEASLNELKPEAVTFARLTFNDQKNAVRGEHIGHWATNDPLLCPCKSLVYLVRHLRSHNVPEKTPICTYYDNAGKRQEVLATHVTNALDDGGYDSDDINF